MPMFTFGGVLPTADNIPYVPQLALDNGSSYFGRGIDGDLTISGSGTEYNITSAPPSPAPGAPSRASYADAINISSIGVDLKTLTTASATTNFFPGDIVIIINQQGVSGSTTNVGNWERGTVVSVGAFTVTLKSPLARIYGNVDNTDLTGQKVTIQRLPEYRTVTFVNGPGSRSVFAPAWGGNVGGLVAFCAQKVTGTGNANYIGNGPTATAANCFGYRGGIGGLGGTAAVAGSGSGGGIGLPGAAGESYTGVATTAYNAGAANGGGGGTGRVPSPGGVTSAAPTNGPGGAGSRGSSVGGSGSHFTAASATAANLARGGGGGGTSSNLPAPTNPGGAGQDGPSIPLGVGGGGTAGAAGGGTAGAAGGNSGTAAPAAIAGTAYAVSNLTSKLYMGSGGGGAAGSGAAGNGGGRTSSSSAGGGSGGIGGGKTPGVAGGDGSLVITPAPANGGGQSPNGIDGPDGGAGGAAVVVYARQYDNVIMRAVGASGGAGQPGGVGGSGGSSSAGRQAAGGGGGGGGGPGGSGAGGACYLNAAIVGSLGTDRIVVSGGVGVPGGSGAAGGAVGGLTGSAFAGAGAGGAGSPSAASTDGGLGVGNVRFIQKTGTGAQLAYTTADGGTFPGGQDFPTAAYKYSF